MNDRGGHTGASPRICILCAELSDNTLARAVLMADLAAPFGHVVIVGPSLTGDLWAPMKHTRHEVRAWHVESVLQLGAYVRWVFRARERYDQFIVCKARPTSLGVAVACQLPARKTLLDIDEWEVGFVATDGGLRDIPTYLKHAYRFLDPGTLNSPWGIHLSDSLIRFFGNRVVSNEQVQARFGGAVLQHVRDPEWLDPDRASDDSLRQEFGLAGRLWVGFVGTIRPHKGVRTLIEALAKLPATHPLGLLLVGADPRDKHVSEMSQLALRMLGDDRVKIVPPFDWEDLPRYVALPDIIALPSEKGFASSGQIPAKLFDAMAMRKPIVASGVNDLPDILDRCGEVVPPGDPEAFAQALMRLVQDPERMKELGANARQKQIERFSYQAGRRTLGRAMGLEQTEEVSLSLEHGLSVPSS